MAVQKNHNLAYDLLVCPAGSDLLDALRSNTAKSLELFRGLLDDIEDLRSESGDKCFSAEWADALHHTGTKVLFNSLNSCGGVDLEEFGMELPTIFSVHNPVPGRRGIFTRRH